MNTLLALLPFLVVAVVLITAGRRIPALGLLIPAGVVAPLLGVVLYAGMRAGAAWAIASLLVIGAATAMPAESH